MSDNDAIQIEEFYAKKFDDAQRKSFINKMERKLHNREHRA